MRHARRALLLGVGAALAGSPENCQLIYVDVGSNRGDSIEDYVRGL